MKKINRFLFTLMLFAGFVVAPPKHDAPVKVEAEVADRLIYFDRVDDNIARWWMEDDPVKIFYWSQDTGNKSFDMVKATDYLYTYNISGTLLDSGGGFTFFVKNRDEWNIPQHETQWLFFDNVRDNGFNYFTLETVKDSGKQTVVPSIYGEKHEVTKYRGGITIGTEEVAKDNSYTPTFVYQQGFKLEGWYTDAGLTTPYVVGKLDSDISLYGKYTAVSDYYVYFRKPDAWGASIYAYYYREGAGIPLGSQAENWPGDSMTEVMDGGHGYVIKVDAGYNPNIIIFNDGDGKNQTGNTPLIAGKVYTYTSEGEVEDGPLNPAVPHDFEYRLFKNWAPWDDAAEDFAEHNYQVGNGVTVAIKAGDTVKMNISSHIWAPFGKLSGANLETYFEIDPNDGNYKAKVSGVYKFTYNESFALGAATEAKTAQITADNSTVAFELVTVENDKIAAVDQRLAEINTCAQYEDYLEYVGFVTDVLGANGMTLISLQNQAKLDLMSRYVTSPPEQPGGGEITARANTTSLSVWIVLLIGLSAAAGFYFLNEKKFNKQ